MKICLLLNPARLIRWHLWLIEDLKGLPGCSGVRVALTDPGEPWPGSLKLAIALEGLIYRRQSAEAAGPAQLEDFGQHRAAEPASLAEFDVVINLAGAQGAAATPGRRLTPLYNGCADELSIVNAVLDRTAITLEIDDSRQRSPNWQSRPALEDSGVIVRSLNNVLSRTTELLLRSLRQAPGASGGTPQSACAENEVRTLHPFSHVAATVVHKARGYLERQVAQGNRWAVAWRDAPACSLGSSSRAQFRIVKDDGRRFYADPFAFAHGGRQYLFCEEYPFETQKGIISVMSRLPGGTWSVATPVIEECHHLSYPFVFEHDGAIWMLPESGDNGKSSLYRAVEFPFKWQKARTLLEGLNGYDATLVRRDGGWWLLVSTRLRTSATSDNLELFYADELLGPWRASAANPILMDCRFSRSAGSVVELSGRLLRPAQDCSKIYGGAISICHITHLSRDNYEQRVTGRIHARDYGVHTYNFANGLEVADVFGRVSRVSHAEILFESHE